MTWTGSADAATSSRCPAGFARNFLFPEGRAIVASAGVSEQAAAMRRGRDLREAKDRETAEAQVSILAGTVLRLEARAGSAGKLFGSVSAADVAEAVKGQKGVELDRHHVVLEEPIKALGTYEVPVQLLRGRRHHGDRRGGRRRLTRPGAPDGCPGPAPRTRPVTGGVTTAWHHDRVRPRPPRRPPQAVERRPPIIHRCPPGILHPESPGSRLFPSTRPFSQGRETMVQAFDDRRPRPPPACRQRAPGAPQQPRGRRVAPRRHAAVDRRHLGGHGDLLGRRLLQAGPRAHLQRHRRPLRAGANRWTP